MKPSALHRSLLALLLVVTTSAALAAEPLKVVAKLENAFERAANSTAARKFLEDAGEQVAIQKGAALRDYITREYEAMGVVAKSLKLSPQ